MNDKACGGDTLIDEEEVWTAVAQLLRAQLTESVWFSTFQDVVPVLSDSSALVVQVPSTLARDRILNRYLAIVTAAMEEIGIGGRRFDVQIGPGESGADSSYDELLGRPIGVQRRQRQRPEVDRRVLE